MASDEMTPEKILRERDKIQAAKEARDIAAYERELAPAIAECVERYRTVTEETLARLKRQGYPGGELTYVFSRLRNPLATWEIYHEEDTHHLTKYVLASDGQIYESNSEDSVWRVYMSPEVISYGVISSINADGTGNARRRLKWFNAMLDLCELIYPESESESESEPGSEPGSEPEPEPEVSRDQLDERPPSRWRRIFGM